MKIGIIGAMNIEVEYLSNQLDNRTSKSIMGTTFHEGLLHGQPVVVVMCGVGKVNAALCAHVLSDHYSVDAIINTGVAGALSDEIEVGDLVISTDAVYHDFELIALGYAPGQVPGMDTFAFAADESLRSTMARLAREVVPHIGVHEGRVASGDQFVGSAERKDWIVNTFGALCCEMEGAAIAHACYLAKVPFVIMRIISDKADGSADVDYPSFKVEAAHRCAAIVEKCVTLVC